MKIAVDCRMSGKSGIGTFLDGILPFIITKNHEFLLIGISAEKLNGFLGTENISMENKIKCLNCSIKIFSVKESFFFPKSLLKEINECSLYFSPYFNIPSGIRIPIYSSIHDIVFLDMPEIAGRMGTFLRKIFYKRAIALSKEIFTVSQFSKNRIIEKLKCTKPINVVYNGIPAYLEKPLIPKPAKNGNIIFIGNIKKHKGLYVLLKAFQIFKAKLKAENIVSPKLIIAGSQANFRTKDSSINKLLSDGTNDIIFTGYLSEKDLHLKLAQSSILVQPSLYEGFGIPPLQALYLETNAIISDIPVFKEIYKDFPVTFFKTNDAEDLSEKLIYVWKKNNFPSNFKKKYSYCSTAQSIMKILEKMQDN